MTTEEVNRIEQLRKQFADVERKFRAVEKSIASLGVMVVDLLTEHDATLSSIHKREVLEQFNRSDLLKIAKQFDLKGTRHSEKTLVDFLMAFSIENIDSVASAIFRQESEQAASISKVTKQEVEKREVVAEEEPPLETLAETLFEPLSKTDLKKLADQLNIKSTTSTSKRKLAELLSERSADQVIDAWKKQWPEDAVFSDADVDRAIVKFEAGDFEPLNKKDLVKISRDLGLKVSAKTKPEIIKEIVKFDSGSVTYALRQLTLPTKKAA